GRLPIVGLVPWVKPVASETPKTSSHPTASRLGLIHPWLLGLGFHDGDPGKVVLYRCQHQFHLQGVLSSNLPTQREEQSSKATRYSRPLASRTWVICVPQR